MRIKLLLINLAQLQWPLVVLAVLQWISLGQERILSSPRGNLVQGKKKGMLSYTISTILFHKIIYNTIGLSGLIGVSNISGYTTILNWMLLSASFA